VCLSPLFGVPAAPHVPPGTCSLASTVPLRQKWSLSGVIALRRAQIGGYIIDEYRLYGNNFQIDSL
jgi:hypothetical protein